MENTVESNVVTESRLSERQQARLQRHKAEVKKGREALASALAKSLVMLSFKGKCRCGLMLTAQDRNPNAKTYHCPRCGRSGPLPLAAQPPPAGLPTATDGNSMGVERGGR